MDKNWTKEFKDKMQDYQEIAPDGLWSDINEALNLTPEQKKPILPVFLRYGGAVAAAAVIILGVWFYWNRSDVSIVDNREYIADSDMADKEILNIDMADTNITDDDLTDIEIANKDLTDKQSVIETIASNGEIYADIPTSEETQSLMPILPENKPENNASKPNDTIIPITQNRPEKGEINRNITEIAISDDLYGFYDDTEKISQKRFNIGATVSGTIGNMSSQAGYATTIDAANVTSFGSNLENEIRMFNRNKEVSSSEKYLQPVKVGIHFKGYISQKWSIGTGLEWTWLHSSLKEGSENYYTSSTSDMHYIGIPLNINFDIWQGRNLNVYAFAGVTMEKCLSGKTSAHYVFNNSATKSEIEKFTEKQLQWSVSAGAGLEYNFTQFAGIYISPGVSWHFDNGSGIDNIYKSRPINFSLSLGFRFHL